MFLGSNDGKMIRTAVFFDGGYFEEVNRYCKFQHPRASRLHVEGVLEFIRHRVAEYENCDIAHCQIVESHYFRGRFSTDAAIEAGKLEGDRRFDEVLMRAGIVQHWRPIDETQARPAEKGIDVLLSLEAFDLAVHNRFDVLALIACDGDYVPLVRKLNGIGTRVMVLAWDFAYDFGDSHGKTLHRETRTSRELIKVASYPIMMNSIIDDRSGEGDATVDGLFVS